MVIIIELQAKKTPSKPENPGTERRAVKMSAEDTEGAIPKIHQASPITKQKALRIRKTATAAPKE